MKSALTRYRVMATIVGVLLVVLILVGVPLKYLTADGSDAQQLGEWITTYLGIAHGWLYMIFLVTAFLLARRERWDVAFTVVTLICGTIPLRQLLGRAPRHRPGPPGGGRGTARASTRLTRAVIRS